MCYFQLIIRNYGQTRLKEIEKHRKLARTAPSVWSPNSPCKGLRSMIASANRVSNNKSPLPGLQLANKEDEEPEQRSGFFNSVKHFISSNRSKHKLPERDKAPRSNIHVHPLLEESPRIFNLSNSVSLRKASKMNGVSTNCMQNSNVESIYETAESPLLTAKSEAHTVSPCDIPDIPVSPTTLETPLSYRGHSNSFSCLASRGDNRRKRCNSNNNQISVSPIPVARDSLNSSCSFCKSPRRSNSYHNSPVYRRKRPNM